MTPRLLPLLLVLAACDTALPDVRHEGEHVRVAPDPGLELCGGTLAHMDDFVVRVSAAFGVDPPTGDDRFTYYWLDPDDFGRRTPCPDYVGGCALYRDVYAKNAPLDHELVHSVSFAYGVGPQIFVEGLARAYEGLGAVREPQPKRPRDVWSFIDANWIAPLDYDVAGSFTSYLIARFGLAEFLAVYRELGPVSHQRGIDRQLRKSLGVGLERTIDDFLADGADCLHEHADPKLSECGAPEIAWDGEYVAEYRRLACEQDDVIGPYGGGDVVVMRSLVVPVEATYDIAVITDDPDLASQLAISLFPCTQCGDDLAVSVVAGHRGTARLGAGRYSLRLHGPARHEARIGYALTRVPEPRED
ncbi:hypothetical protein [Nannocystis sp. SCPEA4]|uniref:hypothetical protein n=1 Tax=Nannocystis sp. SCPEA4 TaxID=2996787 RepID=UPI002272127B|nr:hypothetical protein [Nannocystis sp. SCPEA4]MCY1062217.1 hypothetical protein [Nannocystis sp. SCPEA4]